MLTPTTVVWPLGDVPPRADLYYGVDCRDALKSLTAGSVHCVVTSPPYWGLRDYGGPSLAWGGDQGCPHVVQSDVCVACGAWVGQLGLEETPEGFVEHLVQVFREVRRVLRDDGTLWLNLGDSYGDGRLGRYDGGRLESDPSHWDRPLAGSTRRKSRAAANLKPKDLAGVPWQVALALRADGWYLRSDVVWAKSISGQIQRGTCMPESVQDRPSRSHEYLFLLTKSEHYFYDRRAVLEPNTMRPQTRPQGHKRHRPNPHMPDHTWGNMQRDVASVDGDPSGRNLRTVWAVNPEPYAGAHFATFPRDLVRPCILAGTSARGCCEACGAFVVRRNDEADVWDSSCSCDRETKPCTVLDPFSGSATTGRVALSLSRSFVGLDSNAEYLALATARILGEDAPVDSDDGGILDLLR